MISVELMSIWYIFIMTQLLAGAQKQNFSLSVKTQLAM